MRITFHIHELGRLKDTSFDLHPLLIFTGDSNLGKSYCALLVYGFLKSLETDLFEKFIDRLFDTRTLKGKIAKGEEIKIIFPIKQLETFFNENIQGILGSLLGHEEVNCKVSLEIDEDILIKMDIYNTGSSVSIMSEKVEYEEDDDESIEIDKLPIVLRYYIIGLLNNNLHYEKSEQAYKDVYIFPPARGSILGASYSMQKAIANTRMYAEFLQDMDKLREPHFGKHEISPEIMAQLMHILEGEIKIRQNDIHYHFENQSIPISAAASSIKELAPLFLLLKKNHPSQISLLFEEPESHLHPSMQKKLADLLAYMVNRGAYLQITTHSSYFLSEWNNLLRLHYIQEKNKVIFNEMLKETHISELSVLNPQNIGAYYFEKRLDGSVQLVKSVISEAEQIQFDTFKDTVNQINENRYMLKDKLEELNDKQYENTN